jgi:hypothetical protein
LSAGSGFTEAPEVDGEGAKSRLAQYERLLAPTRPGEATSVGKNHSARTFTVEVRVDERVILRREGDARR